jgi:hypothetical protein
MSLSVKGGSIVLAPLVAVGNRPEVFRSMSTRTELIFSKIGSPALMFFRIAVAYFNAEYLIMSPSEVNRDDRFVIDLIVLLISPFLRKENIAVVISLMYVDAVAVIWRY